MISKTNLFPIALMSREIAKAKKKKKKNFFFEKKKKNMRKKFEGGEHTC